MRWALPELLQVLTHTVRSSQKKQFNMLEELVQLCKTEGEGWILSLNLNYHVPCLLAVMDDGAPIILSSLKIVCCNRSTSNQLKE